MKLKYSMVAILLASSSVISACDSKIVSLSEVDWAHGNLRSLMGGPLGRVEVLKRNLETNIDSIRVCVEHSGDTISPSELILETKLAYAMWLNATGNYGQEEWNYFRFEAKSQCNPQQDEMSAFVVMMTEERAPKFSNHPYQAPLMKCDNSTGRTYCSSSGMTLGWGGPGLYSLSSNQNGGLKKVKFSYPSTTSVSPYVKWRSLSQDVKLNKQLKDTVKEIFAFQYQELLEKEDVTYSELLSLAETLELSAAEGNGDLGFKKSFPKNMEANSQVNFPYTSEYALFHVLLHEVGHQFGMNHAHSPLEHSETGSVGTARLENGKYIEEMSTMAYGREFMFLTDDDKAGIAHASHKVKTQAFN